MNKQVNKTVKLKIRKGDIVKVIAGESRGKQGKVLFVDPAKQRAIVEGVNIQSKHVKPNATYPNGTIEKKEGPVHISNLMLVDTKGNQATRVGRKVVDGKLVRYAKKSGEEIK